MAKPKLECVSTSECRDYCLAMDDLTSSKTTKRAGATALECGWPTNLHNAKKSSETTVQLLGSRLEAVLAEAQEAAEDPERQEIVALATTLIEEFESQKSIWQAYADAAKRGRLITDVEVDLLSEEHAKIKKKNAGLLEGKDPIACVEAVAIKDAYTIENYGLLFDDTTIETVSRVVDNIANGVPTLLVGHKGIAKTKIAKLATGLFSPDGQPTVVGGYGSMMSEDLVGKTELSPEQGTYFSEGIVVSCMEKGLPILVDEVNLADQAEVMRIQDILLQRPGDTFVLVDGQQENGSRKVVIKRGFGVVCTANEASSHYPIRNQLDPAFRDRHDVLTIGYPDIETEHVDSTPKVNSSLVLAAAMIGDHLAPSLDGSELLSFARLAHASQRLYALPASVVAGDLTTTDVIDNSKPLLTDCITPRKMVAVIERVKAGTLPGVTLAGEIERLIVSLDQYGTRNQTHMRGLQALLSSES